MQRVVPSVVADPTGTVQLAIDLSQFPFSGSPTAITPGSTWNLQFWYRDPAGAPTSYNLSDAVHVVFAP